MLVYQHIATFESLDEARDWIPTMYPGQKMPDSWYGLYKELGSAVDALDFKDESASEFAYKTSDPYFELVGKYRARGPGGLQLDILKCLDFERDVFFYSVVKYRGFATQVGDNKFRVY